MTTGLRRDRPARTTFSTLIGLLWSLTAGAFRDFVWADLRSGLIDLRGLSRVTRGLICLGFALLLVMVGALLFNDLWRARFPLLSTSPATPGRGELLPLAIVPATFLLLSMAWSFALAGALHSHPAIRLAFLLLYLLVAATWTGIGAIGFIASPSPVEQWLALLPLAAVPLFFVLRWRAPARPLFEFEVLLVAVSATFSPAQARVLDLLSVDGLPLILDALDNDLVTISALAVPLLLLVGLSLAGFVYQAAGWTVEILASRLPRWTTYAALALLLGRRLLDVTREALQRAETSGLPPLLGLYPGALAIPLLVGSVWWLANRLAGPRADPLPADEIARAAEAHAPWLVMASQAMSLMGLILGLAWLALDAAPSARFTAANPFDTWSTLLYGWEGQWRRLLEAGALLAALWLARRGRRATALYLGLFGAIQLYLELTAPGRLLARLDWRGSEPVDFWWCVVLALVGLLWLVRGRLTPERAIRLLAVVLMTALLRQTDFIGNRFSPFFGFAGIGFVAFGIVWDALTIGSWANVDSAALPRVSRVFLYLGYVLFTVTLVNWFLTAHNLAMVDMLTEDAALAGLAVFGKPMLYGLYAALLWEPPPGGLDHRADGQRH